MKCILVIIKDNVSECIVCDDVEAEDIMESKYYLELFDNDVDSSSIENDYAEINLSNGTNIRFYISRTICSLLNE